MKNYRSHRLNLRIARIIFLVSGFWLLVSSLSYAAVPHLINYQGRLTDSQGVPLDNVTRNITFRIYDAETGTGTMTPWEETHTSVPIQKGIFSVILGSITPLNLPFDRQYWLEIKVQDETLTPRQLITSVGYAIRSENSENANTITNVEVSTTPQANKILPLDNNAKFPLSTLGLKVYDSGWFAVTGNPTTTTTKTHNLGTTKVIAVVYFAENSDGSGASACTQEAFPSNSSGHSLYNLTTTQISLANAGAINLWNGSSWNNYNSFYTRIIMLALE